MKIDPSSALALKAVVERDLQSVESHEAAVQGLACVHEQEVIAIAYHLHNLYNALENSFDRISRTFENHVKDAARWHHELLGKMFLDLSPLRPAVLPESVRPVLNDLRGFRHVFRHNYDAPLEADRVIHIRTRWLKDGPAVKEALKVFAAELGRCAAAA